MSHYTGAVPDAERDPDWRNAGLCRSEREDAEDWFPVGSSREAVASENHAKAVCGRCPSQAPCRTWGLEQREPAGIWGGLTEAERRTILRRRGVSLAALDDEAPPRTLQTIWDSRAKATADGHCEWHGGRPIGFQGAYYTPQQIGFTLDRGRPPVGHLRRTCTRDDCILPAHLADQQEREERSRIKEAAS